MSNKFESMPTDERFEPSESVAEDKESNVSYVPLSAETEVEARKIFLERGVNVVRQRNNFLDREGLSKENKDKIRKLCDEKIKMIEQDRDEDIAFILEKANGEVDKSITDFETILSGI